MQTDTTIRSSLLVLATVAVFWTLFVTRDLVAPFALAVFFWLAIDALARSIDGISKRIPYWFALTIAAIITVGALVGLIVVIADTVGSVVDEAPRYQARINEIFGWIGRMTGQDVSYSALNARFGITALLQGALAGFAATIQAVLSDFMLIAIYVVFLFVAQAGFPAKMDNLFPDEIRRARAQRIGSSIRHSIEDYISVQTIISLIQTVISYIAMVVLGLDNALFWALVIFILNYIPIVGGFAAVVMPVLFGLVQFDSLAKVAILGGVLFGAQFVVANTLQPKMMGDSMNMSPLVVVLSLTLWGALWGGVGAFLSAPMTVVLMIILAQFTTTRWIAVLLSADGDPDMDGDGKPDIAPMPSL
ncbi:AI-2E family transporter [Algimonas porphyrae]|uniref:AI-2E family transporter n=1 Tax=Algimonas porphyrae TaxID=1128113 RepID=A0ABQ5V118_9PROT|nr:AI-2E family transporter [Algimonas porphyrae]GLQ21243.1 AI-2E family transporter [Algimonas porphyrae]